MKKNVLGFLTLALLGSTLFSSCKKDTTTENEAELITTVMVSLIEQGTTAPIIFAFRDPDGEGGNAPIQFDEIELDANKVYDCFLTFLDESKNPPENITEEIEEEADEHQIYYGVTGTSTLNVTNLDLDGDGLPLGINSVWTTGAASTGKVKITLKHKPGSKAAGDPVSKGETDVELDFDVIIQ